MHRRTPSHLATRRSATRTDAATLDPQLVADPVYVLDTVLAEIEADIAAHPPERGGALLGAPGLSIVTEFLHDRWARTTGASYQPSLLSREGDESLESSVHLVESATGLRFRGYVHSHPGGLDLPSGQDLVSFADTLRINPALRWLEVPIVTNSNVEAPRPHEATLASGKISWFSVRSGMDGRSVCAPRRLVVSPLGSELNALATDLGAEADAPGWQPTTVDGARVLRASLLLADGSTLELYVRPDQYPSAAPEVIVIDDTGKRHQVSLRWDEADDGLKAVAERVHASVRSRAGRAAAEIGAESASVNVAAGLRARLDGIVPPSIRGARVSVFGLGSGGSQMVEVLVRSGVEHFALVDSDRVSVENLSRSTYVFDDIGRLKTDALAQRITAINPGAHVETHASSVQDLSAVVLDRLASSAGLLIGATDDPGAQALINLHAYRAGTPAVFGGVYEYGQGGEAVFTIPGLTPCYRCATAIRHSGSHQLLGGHDYGLRPGRLTGAPALGADIAHVAAAAAKIGLALLVLDQSDSPLVAEFLAPSMAHTSDTVASLVQFAMVAGYDYFPRVFGGVAGQGAWQTVWLTVHPDPDCPICGEVSDHKCVDVGPPPPALDPISLEEIAAAIANARPPDEDHAP